MDSSNTEIIKPDGKYLTKDQLAIIGRQTPKEHIKSRQGRGGSFSYVEVGYVISTLNEAFGPAWDWEVIDQQVGKRQVWVKGRLTIWFSPDVKFCKSAFGGSDIKTYSTGNYAGEPVDVGDDLKAASSDALKKAASMFGIAADIYFPQMDNLNDGQEKSSYP